jgi:hypothetical protein
MYPSPNIIHVIKEDERDGWGMWHVWGTGEVREGFWWGDLMER